MFKSVSPPCCPKAPTAPCAESEAARGQTEKDPLAPDPKPLVVEGKRAGAFILPEEHCREVPRAASIWGWGRGSWMFPLRGQVGWRREPSSHKIPPPW